MRTVCELAVAHERIIWASEGRFTLRDFAREEMGGKSAAHSALFSVTESLDRIGR